MIALHLGDLLDWRAGLIRSDYTAISIVIRRPVRTEQANVACDCCERELVLREHVARTHRSTPFSSVNKSLKRHRPNESIALPRVRLQSESSFFQACPYKPGLVCSEQILQIASSSYSFVGPFPNRS
jgi:hypothetical protein